MEGFLCKSLRDLYLEGFIHGGAYFRNFTAVNVRKGVCNLQMGGLIEKQVDK